MNFHQYHNPDTGLSTEEAVDMYRKMNSGGRSKARNGMLWVYVGIMCMYLEKISWRK
jgi:hypothetical protein